MVFSRRRHVYKEISNQHEDFKVALYRIWIRIPDIYY